MGIFVFLLKPSFCNFRSLNKFLKLGVHIVSGMCGHARDTAVKIQKSLHPPSVTWDGGGRALPRQGGTLGLDGRIQQKQR